MAHESNPFIDYGCGVGGGWRLVGVMWARYRKWKHGVAPLLVGFGYFAMHLDAVGSALHVAGVVSVFAVVLAYVVEEIVWNVKDKGRPCAACGHRIRMESFHIRNTCPNCGEQL